MRNARRKMKVEVVAREERHECLQSVCAGLAVFDCRPDLPHSCHRRVLPHARHSSNFDYLLILLVVPNWDVVASRRRCGAAPSSVFAAGISSLGSPSSSVLFAAAPLLNSLLVSSPQSLLRHHHPTRCWPLPPSADLFVRTLSSPFISPSHTCIPSYLLRARTSPPLHSFIPSSLLPPAVACATRSFRVRYALPHQHFLPCLSPLAVRDSPRLIPSCALPPSSPHPSLLSLCFLFTPVSPGTVTASPPPADCHLILVRRSLIPADRIPFRRRGLDGASQRRLRALFNTVQKYLLSFVRSLFLDAPSIRYSIHNPSHAHTLLFSYPIMPVPSPMLSSLCTSPPERYL
ncbi:hypothetical protein C8J57DRAFT_1519128 [Mycena rebaudengoi]|nr:hypothetical protein C8J57DRAFT_1519128 [Mycena rebaudengoi]